jgi:imidazolonepropionase-like amidohydrolase
MKRIIRTIALLLLCGVFAVSSEIPGKPQDHPIALTGATIHPVSGPVIEQGTILFDKGKIVALGTNVTLPPGTEKISAAGKHIYPGLIDARSGLGLVEVSAVRATRDNYEVGSINPNIRAEVGVNPESEHFPVHRANGITTAITMPTGGTIAGSAAAIMMDGWTWEEMTLRAPVGMVVNWPDMTINHAWWEQRSEEDQKKARDKSLQEIRDAVRDARAYLAAKKSETDKGIPFHKSDLRWEAMAPVLEGKIPVLVSADDIQQIESAVAWADAEHVKIVIMGGYDSWRAADLLKAKNIPVVVNPILQLPRRRWESYDAGFTIPKKLFESGIKFCIAADGGYENERNLPYHAAMAAAYGLPKEEALKSVTLYAAQIMGVDDLVGSLETGKEASLIVTNGDPLEITTRVEMEFIQGKNVSLQSKHTRLYDKYGEKYRREKQ